jgi:hypothetical protein
MAYLEHRPGPRAGWEAHCKTHPLPREGVVDVTPVRYVHHHRVLDAARHRHGQR